MHFKYAFLMFLIFIFYGCESKKTLSDIERVNVRGIALSLKDIFSNKDELILVKSNEIDQLPPLEKVNAAVLYCQNKSCFVYTGIQENLPEIDEVICLLIKHNNKIIPITYYRKKHLLKTEGFILKDKRSEKLMISNCPNYGVIMWYPDEVTRQGGVEFSLGFMYQNGLGVKQDGIKALEWYRKAAEQGNAMAQNNLGNMYSSGQVVKQNNIEAIKWYRKAVEQGDSIGKHNLEYFNRHGGDVRQNNTKQIIWYTRETRG